MDKLARRLTDFFSSRAFWYVVLGFFILEALWFVFSALYPMAFDEDFHVGVIRIYAEQWSPFLSSHPAGADQFGAIIRDPSYFYHYLMSFPYRAVSSLIQAQEIQIVILRLLNVALFAWGLILFRKVMVRAGASQALAHVSLALFVLIPIVPQLAAHINYDNLLMVLLPLMCLAVFNLVDSFRKQQIDVSAGLGFVVVCLYMSIVKYAALPFMIAAVLFLAVMFVRQFKGHLGEVWPAIKRSFTSMRRPLQVSLLALGAIGLVLFVQRYGVNMMQYGTPVPDCGQVLSVEQCSAYGPWGRDYYYGQVKAPEFSPNPIAYMDDWLYGMWYRLFFAVNGATSVFANFRPLPLPAFTAIAVISAGILATIVWWRSVFRGRAYLIFCGLLIAVYCVILWLDQYGMYQATAQPVAINGRYLLPILPLVAVITGIAFGAAFKTLKIERLKPLVAAVVILLFLHGGGVFTFILRSDDSWYWLSQPVQAVNDSARAILAPITIEGPKQ